jgi:hypothetical protein
LTSTLEGSEWSASRPGPFTSRDKAPGTRWRGGWVGPRRAGEEKNSQPLPGLETPIIQPVAQRYTIELFRFFLNDFPACLCILWLFVKMK